MRHKGGVEMRKSEYDLFYDLRRRRKVVEERITSDQLGAAYPMWKEMRQISEMEPVQARAMTSVDF